MIEPSLSGRSEAPQSFGLSWANPTSADRLHDDAQAWASRVAESAQRELERLEPLQARFLEGWIRTPLESDADASFRASLGAFFRETIGEATYYLEWARSITESGVRSLRQCLQEQGYGADDYFFDMPD